MSKKKTTKICTCIPILIRFFFIFLLRLRLLASNACLYTTLVLRSFSKVRNFSKNALLSIMEWHKYSYFPGFLGVMAVFNSKPTSRCFFQTYKTSAKIDEVLRVSQNQY